MQSIYVEVLGPRKVGLLGKMDGGFAQVLILANENGAPSYAFKVLKQSVGSAESVVTEINALSRLPAHPHVVEVMGYSPADVGAGILLTYRTGGVRCIQEVSG